MWPWNAYLRDVRSDADVLSVWCWAAFSISSENSQVVLIAISSAVAIILLAVVLYIVIGR